MYFGDASLQDTFLLFGHLCSWGKAVGGTTNTPNTYRRTCSLGMRRRECSSLGKYRVLHPIFNNDLSFQDEILKGLVSSGLLKILIQ